MIARFLALLALAASLVVAGCGGGDEGAPLSADKLSAVKVPLRAGAAVTPNDAAELLLNAAEAAYPQYFPSHQPSQTFGPFRFRQYGNTYIGVTVTADAAYSHLYGVYVVGPAFGNTLANPLYIDSVTTLLGNSFTIDTGLNTGHNLIVTVQALGMNLGPYTLTNVPAPNTSDDFCSGLSNDTIFSQITASGVGTLHIDSCSFSGLTGHITMTFTISAGGFNQTLQYTVTYTYQ